ncbi:MAG: DUF2225 domain-containing protein [candidate division Zixibacteria bacterium]|nr:DUF2225 domain-containing protein [candidate division Zixibacteria bacterium]
MVNDSPFILTKIECPICKTVNEFEVLKVGSYTEEGRDSDFCPQSIKWRSPRYQAYNPLVFFTAACSNCYYTRELTNQFKDWKNDNNFRTYRLKTIKQKHLEQFSNPDSIINQMGKALNQNRYPNETAILKLHLAVFDELLSDYRSDLDLGRFYLRIAWVFRGMEKGEDPNKSLLNGLVLELENRYGAIKTAAVNISSEIDAFSGQLQNHFDSKQVPAEIKSEMYTYHERYDREITALKNSLKNGEDILNNLRQLIDEYKSTILGGSGVNEVNGFGNENSLTDYLHAMKLRWDGVVANEREALEKAVYYYKQAFANGRDILPGNQQIQASYLIAELSRRIGDYDEAKQYFTSTIKTGQEFIYQNRHDQSRTVLARKILELAIEQGRANLKASKPA